MTPHLRPATMADLPAIHAMIEAAYAPWIPVIGRRPGPMDDDYAARIAAGEAWTAERDGAAVGLLVLVEGAGALLLDNIAVAPAAQGTGLGRVLMAHAETEAARRGYGRITLYTHALMAANIALYQRLGYGIDRRVEENGFDRVYMSKAIR